MKNFIFSLILVAALATISHAETKSTSKGDYPLVGSSTHTEAIREHVHEYTDTDTTIPDTDTHAKQTHNTIGVKVDAPNLVKLTKNTTIGIEGGKDIAHDLFYPDDYGYFEADRGYFGYVKLTYKGNLFDFSK